MTADLIQIELDNIVRVFNATRDMDMRIRLAKKYNKLLLKHVKLFEYDLKLETPDYEVWRNIKGWEGVYQISNFGKVKSFLFFVIKKRARSDKYMAAMFPAIIRKQGTHKFGYKKISLWRNGKPSHYMAHILVGRHFIPNPHKYPQVLHLDNNPSNSYFKNLV